MIEYILSKYPGMKASDINLQDDGKGIFVSYWNSTEPKPTMEQIKQWQDEINNAPRPLSETEELRKQVDLMQAALDDLILGGAL